jgi:biotin carboxyl carrier protein
MDETLDEVTERLSGLLDVLQGTDVQELEVTEGDVRVKLHRNVVQRAEQEVDPVVDVELASEPPVVPVTAPLVGTFYRAGKPGMAPLVSEGSVVEDDTVVGIIEALQVLTEVEAGCSGQVVTVLATDGQPVEYGQRLFEVRTRG